MAEADYLEILGLAVVDLVKDPNPAGSLTISTTGSRYRCWQTRLDASRSTRDFRTTGNRLWRLVGNENLQSRVYFELRRSGEPEVRVGQDG